jgi:DNA invertase Pin-like site-specific DNA recombinase
VTLTAEQPWTIVKHRGRPNVVGYARVSTRDQSLDAQLTRLREAGCSRIYAEKLSGAKPRAGWAACIEALREGDTLCVVRVDRMGRRLAELVRSLDEIRALGAHVQALEEGLDTSAKGGAFAFTIVAALAEKVRDDISANTRAGLAEVKKRGAQLGRPSKLSPAKLAQLVHLRAQGYSFREIAAATHVSRGTVQRGLELAAAAKVDPRQLQLGGVP